MLENAQVAKRLCKQRRLTGNFLSLWVANCASSISALLSRMWSPQRRDRGPPWARDANLIYNPTLLVSNITWTSPYPFQIASKQTKAKIPSLKKRKSSTWATRRWLTTYSKNAYPLSPHILVHWTVIKVMALKWRRRNCSSIWRRNVPRLKGVVGSVGSNTREGNSNGIVRIAASGTY